MKRDRHLRILFRKQPYIGSRKSSLNNQIEVGLKILKSLFYVSIIAGVIWNLIYFGFFVHVLPDFDIENLAVYLVSIFGIGFIMISPVQQ
ncbi:MAG: hypothetical protein HY096_10455 [Nitrospinae bacterium]|nr:hypothetical protein [Nitrospinota bacterium]